MTVTEQPLNPGARMPLLIQSRDPAASPADYAARNRDHLLKQVEACGAIVLRGFDLRDADGFGAFVGALDIPAMPYTYRSTPRVSVGNGLYTATEYPADREIPMHNENAYQRTWPNKIAFCCVQPATTGGATPLADMLEVERLLGPELMARFGALGVRYDRVYYEGFDLPWQEVFQTNSKGDVERFCDVNEIRYEWLDEGGLKTTQVSQGTLAHPCTGHVYYFNQAHLFHPSSLGEETRAYLIEAFGEDMLPRNARFGNGEAIGDATLSIVRDAFDAAAVDVVWQRGDIVLADNIQVAHGRRSYTGARRVLTSLLEPSR